MNSSRIPSEAKVLFKEVKVRLARVLQASKVFRSNSDNSREKVAWETYLKSSRRCSEAKANREASRFKQKVKTLC